MSRLTTFVVATLLLVLATALPTAILAQTAIKEYSTRPSLSYTFDVNPLTNTVNGQLQSANSRFGYAIGAGSHAGLISMDGSVSDQINLNYFFDDMGLNMTSMRFGGEMSFEVWGAIMQVRSWTRYFDFGAGPNGQSDNLFCSLQGSSTNLICYTYNGTSSSNVQVSNALNLYQWQHLVFTVTRNVAGTTSATAATLSLYVNGVLRATAPGFLPNVMTRPSSFFGHSNWAGDQGYRGLLDDIFIYNYSLSAEAIAAHYVVPRIAAFELVFSTDPRLNMNLNGQTATYNWAAFDASDSPANQAGHKGLVVLSSNQFLNVGDDNGVSAVGTELPTIGGAGWANADNDTVGWTFEVTTKFTSLVAESCVFDFSTSTNAHHISMCLSRTGSTLQFTVSDASSSVSIDVASITMGTWYHFAVNVQPYDSANGVARYEVFVNGKYARSTNAGRWPISIARTSALIGRSFNGVYMNGLVDSLRVYDYSLSAAEVIALSYAVAGLTAPVVTPLYTTAPSIAHTFDEFVPWAERNQGTALDWVGSMSGRAGVISLSGSGQYVNLLTLPDRNYQLFPGQFGARSISFEFWIMFTRFNSWQRILDLSAQPNVVVSGTAVYQDNIFLATLVQPNSTLAASMVFAVVAGPDGFTDSRVQHSDEVYLNRWYHIVLTIKQDRSVRNTSNPQAAQLQLYVNGNLDAYTNTAVPRFVSRPNSNIGVSRYAADGFLGAYIDSFYYYDYPLEVEQVRAHYSVQRPPVFELTFSSVPSSMPSMNATNNFGWTLVDAASSAGGRVNHPGLLVLAAASQQYVDLTAISGTTTIGAVMPQLATLPDFPAYLSTSTFLPEQLFTRIGMTIETSFQYTSLSGANAKLFSCGSAAGADLIELGFNAGTRDFVLTVSNSDVQRSSTIKLMENAYFQKWFHLAVALRITSQSYDAVAQVYVNGVLAQTILTGVVFPYATPRDVCTIGRSVSGAADTYFDGLVDLFRVYDHVLNATEVGSIYALTNPQVDTAAGIAPVADASSSSSSLSGGAIAGIVIGCIVGVVLVVVVFVLYRRSAKGDSSSSGGAGGRAEQKHIELSEVREDASDEHEAEETA